MGGIPWWAALIGTPIVAGKMASGVAETVDSLNKVNDAWDTRKDKQQLALDATAFGTDPTHQPSIGDYRNPETWSKAKEFFGKKAAAPLEKTLADWKGRGWDSDKSFTPDEWTQGMLDTTGTKVNPANPFETDAVNKFRQNAQDIKTVFAANNGDPFSLARMAVDKDLASGAHLSAQSANIPLARQTADAKEARIQQKEDFAEKEKLDTAAQQAEFERIAAGIGGRYQDAQPKQFNQGADGTMQQVPITAPEGKQPNVWNGGFNYVDGKGDVTPRRIMPYEEARATLMQAAADYPKANTKEALAGLEKQYNQSYSNADYVPSAQNWMGTATNDKNQLQLAANSGDRIAKGILSELDRRELAQAKGKREIIVANPSPSRASGRLSINDIPDSDAALLNDAIASGQLNADKVNSRTAHLYVKMLKSNPSLDFNNSAATSGALKKLETQRSVIQTFEQTASKNFDLVERLYNQNPQGTIYLLNQLKTNFNTKITGDPQTVAMGRALKTALNEYAKVVTGQTGGAAVSDSARKEVETLLSQADKPEAFRQSLANHRQEMRNRMEAFDETMTALKGGRGGNVRGTIAPAGTRVPRKGGGFYTSDGKGGWS